MKLISTLTASLIVLSSVLASPVPPRFRPRDDTVCPDQDYLNQYVKDSTTFVGYNFVFYTGNVISDSAQHYAHSLNSASWADVYSNNQKLDWIVACQEQGDSSNVIPYMARALAENVEGQANVLQAPGETPAPNSVWIAHEYDVLYRRGIKVFAVNADDTSDYKDYDGQPFIDLGAGPVDPGPTAGPTLP